MTEMETIDMSDPDTTQASVQELLTFRLEDGEYSVDIMSVREIRSWSRATPLPHAPDYVSGVINLRGSVLPVLDLSLRLGNPAVEPSDRCVVIVVETNGRMVGLRVDAVSDIVSIPSDDMQPPPEISSRAGPRFIRALTIQDDRMIRILDLTAVLPAEMEDAA